MQASQVTAQPTKTVPITTLTSPRHLLDLYFFFIVLDVHLMFRCSKSVRFPSSYNMFCNGLENLVYWEFHTRQDEFGHKHTCFYAPQISGVTRKCSPPHFMLLLNQKLLSFCIKKRATLSLLNSSRLLKNINNQCNHHLLSS